MSGPYVLGGTVTVWEDALTPSELDAIICAGDALAPERAQVAGYETSMARKTHVAWIMPDDATLPLYNRLTQVVLALNNRFYHYDLTGLENFQYTLYRGDEGAHHDWHVDTGPHTERVRKLSLSIQLSEPDDYDGCALELFASSRVDVAPKKRGTVICFPSFAVHRVTPITRGVRKALVCWAAGPGFR
jgi:PKHD-type hydroxylase